MDGDDDHSRAGGRNFSHDGHDVLDGLGDCDDDEEEEDDDDDFYPRRDTRLRSPYTLLG